MKTRQLLTILCGTVLFVFVLLGCSLMPVSIDQRISTFFSDLNSSDRSNVYQNFHPTSTTEYNALKDPVGSGFNTLFPVPGPSYSYIIVTESNTSAVIVQVTAGPMDGSGFAPPTLYLSLSMDTTNGNDWRIVTLGDSNFNGGYIPRIN